MTIEPHGYKPHLLESDEELDLLMLRGLLSSMTLPALLNWRYVVISHLLLSPEHAVVIRETINIKQIRQLTSHKQELCIVSHHRRKHNVEAGVVGGAAVCAIGSMGSLQVVVSLVP